MNRERLERDVAAAPFFLGLSDHHVRLLTDCASHVHFEDDQTVFRQGETANRFYLLESGSVQLETTAGANGRLIPVDTIESGGLLGWSWMFPPFEWQFTARALTATEAIFFYGTVLREYCEKDSSLGFELLKRMSEVMVKRLQSARTRLVEARSDLSLVGRKDPIAIGA